MVRKISGLKGDGKVVVAQTTCTTKNLVDIYSLMKLSSKAGESNSCNSMHYVQGSLTCGFPIKPLAHRSLSLTASGSSILYKLYEKSLPMKEGKLKKDF